MIGKNSIVGANALVSEGKIFPENSLILGVPAKVKRELKETDIDAILENAAEYVELTGEYLEICLMISILELDPECDMLKLKQRIQHKEAFMSLKTRNIKMKMIHYKYNLKDEQGKIRVTLQHNRYYDYNEEAVYKLFKKNLKRKNRHH